MPAKESSDELNPTTATVGIGLARRPRRLSWQDYLSLSLASWGVGFLPLAPGTWGSLVGVGLFLLLHRISVQAEAFGRQNGWRLPAAEDAQASLLALAVIAISLAGIWAASRAERLLNRKDPGVVVVDEVAGQLMAFLFVPFNARPWLIVAAFLAFRLFDIWKPYPIRRLEALEAGLGIMADDLLAGAYAAALILFVVTLYQFF